MQDCRNYINSWIAIRLEDESKWIGVLSDIDINNSIVVLQKGKLLQLWENTDLSAWWKPVPRFPY